MRRTHEIVGSTAVFVEAAQSAGFPWLPDLNDGGSTGLPTGIGAVPLNIVDGVRTGPGAAFLGAGLDAAQSQRAVGYPGVGGCESAGGRAIGVDVTGPTGPAVLTADRIVLSAGAIGSAHL